MSNKLKQTLLHKAMRNSQNPPAIYSLMQAIDNAQSLYSRLVIVAGELGSGKTTLLSSLSKHMLVPYINIGIEMPRIMLDVGKKQRIVRLPDIMTSIVEVCLEKNAFFPSKSGTQVVLLDNTEALFDFQLRQDPIRLLQKLSRNATLVVSWTGHIENNKLQYATPQHPEYRQYPMNDLLVFDMKNVANF